MEKLEELLDKIWDGILAVFSEAEKIAITFLSAAASNIAKSGGALLVDAARAAVKAAEENGGNGSQKRDAAFEAVKGTLENAGMTVIVSAVYAAIEAAVAEMNT